LTSSPTRGLATIALLKLNFDAGRDHIAMFEPFVRDAIGSLPTSDFSLEELQAAITSRHQLLLPASALRTLLARTAREGYVRREGGRYFRSPLAREVPDLLSSRGEVEARQQRLAVALREAASQHGLALASDDAALALILEFLERNHVSLALTGESFEAAVTEPSDADRSDKRLSVTARFLRDALAAQGDLASIIQECLEGYILQNTLLLKDIASASRRFRNLQVYCDSGLLFRVLGLHDQIAETATKELFSLLRQTGAGLNAFDTTLREMRRILDVHEKHIGTSAGRMLLRPSDLTRFLLTARFSPSDVREQNALLELNLGGLGVNIRQLPAHRAESTLDEKNLASRLADKPDGESADRVTHDVDCVAGILTMRAGQSSDTLDDARFVFASTGALTVRNTTAWYRSQGGAGVAPMIHYLVLSNLAWLKKPSSASGLKVHELMALCVAALRPSRATWQTFVRYLKSLERSGRLSSDEVTAMVANSLTDRVLADEDVDEDSDAATLSEVVERIKANYSQVAADEVGRATALAAKSEAEALRIRHHINRRARGLARVLTWTVATLLALSFVAGTLISIDAAVTGSSPSASALLLAILPLAIFGLLSLLSGFHLLGWRAEAEDRITRLFDRWIAGSEESRVGPERVTPRN
jgi:hypothetical protein